MVGMDCLTEFLSQSSSPISRLFLPRSSYTFVAGRSPFVLTRSDGGSRRRVADG
jgi:hypothetical protein